MSTHVMHEELSIDEAALDFSSEPPHAVAPYRDPRPDSPDTGPKTRMSVSLLLRGLGGLVIVAAFVMFLFQGWRDGDDLTRCLLLLGHTAVLTLAGFASGSLLREAKGARLFIALALAAVPVSFAFLGGLTYEHLTWDAPRAIDSAASIWTTPSATLSASGALTLAGASVAGLALTVWIGFLIMARRSVWPLTGLYLLVNAALLIPTRDDLVVSGVLVSLGIVVGIMALRLRRRDSSLATPEGIFARAVMIAPLLVLGGRSLWLYAPDALFFTAMSLIGYFGLRMGAIAAGDDRRWRGAFEAGALLLAGLSTFLAYHSVIHSAAIPAILKLPLTAAVLAGLLVDLSTLGTPWRAGYRSAAALVATLAMLLNLSFGGFGNALASLGVGIAVLVYGYAARGRLPFAMGLITALTGLGVAAHGALSSFTIGGWSALVLLGILIIVAGSVVERHGARLKADLSRWYRHFEAEA